MRDTRRSSKAHTQSRKGARKAGILEAVCSSALAELPVLRQISLVNNLKLNGLHETA